MTRIVDVLMTAFKSDFTEADTDFICRTQARVPFCWLVRKFGTHLCACSDIRGLRELAIRIDFLERQHDDYCLFRYDGRRLHPAFAGDFRDWLVTQISDADEQEFHLGQIVRLTEYARAEWHLLFGREARLWATDFDQRFEVMKAATAEDGTSPLLEVRDMNDSGTMTRRIAACHLQPDNRNP